MNHTIAYLLISLIINTSIGAFVFNGIDLYEDMVQNELLEIHELIETEDLTINEITFFNQSLHSILFFNSIALNQGAIAPHFLNHYYPQPHIPPEL